MSAAAGLPAWCGACGGGFALAEAVAAGSAGSCPRCGTPFAPGYAVVLAAAVRQVLAAVDSLESGLRQVKEVAPLLHVDVRRALAELSALSDVPGREP